MANCPKVPACSKLNVLRMQALTKFYNLAVTGKVGTICTRHAFMQSNSVCDIYGGEKCVCPVCSTSVG